MNKYLFSFLMILITVGLVPGVKADTVVRCESQSYRYRYCRVTTYNRVRLVRELSDAQCREGRSWGFDYRGIWVDRGCRGEFVVEDRPGDNRWEHGSPRPGGIFGSIFGGSHGSGYGGNDYEWPPRRGAPSWVVGTFRGYDPALGSDVEMTIYPSGAVAIFTRGRRGSGDYTDGGIRMDSGNFYQLRRERNGFVMYQRGGYRDVRFYRVR